MEKEIDFKYHKCGFCRYFLPWGDYEENASADDTERGKCMRYPPKINLGYYPFFLKKSIRTKEDLAQVEHSGRLWSDADTNPEEVVQTCSILPYVQMDDFCGEFKPAHISQLKKLIDLYETYNISTENVREGLIYFQKYIRQTSKKSKLI